MVPWTFLFPYGEKYVLVLDLCSNVIVMEIVRWHLEEDFQSYARRSAFGAAGHAGALFCSSASVKFHPTSRFFFFFDVAFTHINII